MEDLALILVSLLAGIAIGILSMVGVRSSFFSLFPGSSRRTIRHSVRMITSPRSSAPKSTINARKGGRRRLIASRAAGSARRPILERLRRTQRSVPASLQRPVVIQQSEAHSIVTHEAGGSTVPSSRSRVLGRILRRPETSEPKVPEPQVPAGQVLRVGDTKNSASADSLANYGWRKYPQESGPEFNDTVLAFILARLGTGILGPVLYLQLMTNPRISGWYKGTFNGARKKYSGYSAHAGGRYFLFMWSPPREIFYGRHASCFARVARQLWYVNIGKKPDNHPLAKIKAVNTYLVEVGV